MMWRRQKRVLEREREREREVGERPVWGISYRKSSTSNFWWSLLGESECVCVFYHRACNTCEQDMQCWWCEGRGWMREKIGMESRERAYFEKRACTVTRVCEWVREREREVWHHPIGASVTTTLPLSLSLAPVSTKMICSLLPVVSLSLLQRCSLSRGGTLWVSFLLCWILVLKRKKNPRTGSIRGSLLLVVPLLLLLLLLFQIRRNKQNTQSSVFSLSLSLSLLARGLLPDSYATKQEADSELLLWRERESRERERGSPRVPFFSLSLGERTAASGQNHGSWSRGSGVTPAEAKNVRLSSITVTSVRCQRHQKLQRVRSGDLFEPVGL